MGGVETGPVGRGLRAGEALPWRVALKTIESIEMANRPIDSSAATAVVTMARTGITVVASGMPVVSGITWKSGVGEHSAAIATGAHRRRDQRSSYSIRNSARVGKSKGNPARSVPECRMS